MNRLMLTGDLQSIRERVKVCEVNGHYQVRLGGRNVQHLKLQSNTNILLPYSCPKSESYVLYIEPKVAGATVAWLGSNITWEGTSSASTPPTLATTAGTVNVLTFTYCGGKCYGWLAGKN